MPRTVKDPEERKAELLDTAMRLFAEKGYDNVSVRSVAREAGVASGLAYHYFDSKQRLFDAAIGHYAERCSERRRAALDDGALSRGEKIEGAIAAAPEHAAIPHGSRLHAEGNGTLHDRLSLGICEAVRPRMQAALELDAARRGAPAGDAALLASMMVYACVGLASGPGMPDDAAADAARRYLGALVAEYRRGPSGR